MQWISDSNAGPPSLAVFAITPFSLMPKGSFLEAALATIEEANCICLCGQFPQQFVRPKRPDCQTDIFLIHQLRDRSFSAAINRKALPEELRGWLPYLGPKQFYLGHLPRAQRIRLEPLDGTRCIRNTDRCLG
jgi:hypothetical protein